jgi:hypothetical protein
MFHTQNSMPTKQDNIIHVSFTHLDRRDYPGNCPRTLPQCSRQKNPNVRRFYSIKHLPYNLKTDKTWCWNRVYQSQGFANRSQSMMTNLKGLLYILVTNIHIYIIIFKKNFTDNSWIFIIFEIRYLNFKKSQFRISIFHKVLI